MALQCLGRLRGVGLTGGVVAEVVGVRVGELAAAACH